MSSVVISGDTSGQITLAAPAVSGTNTITLPAATGTVLTTAGGQTITGNTTVSGTVVMGSPFTMRNKIINGAMQIWQRGTSFSSGYTADRWFIAYGTSPTFSRSTDVPSSGFEYSMSVSGSGQPTLAQRIESVNCKDLGNATITISFWAKLTSGSGNLYAFLVYPSATDNYTTVTTSSNYQFTPTSSWAYYTITIPSISANAVNGLGLSITSVSSSAITYLITGVQLEIGTAATPFEYRNYQQELAMCQRYFQLNTSSLAYGLGSTSVTLQYNPPVYLRATPTLSLTTTTPYWESVAWNTIGSLTSATVDGTHMSSSGGDIRINGTFSPAPSYGSLSLLGTSFVRISAEL